jgi:hypothetical protein
MINERCWTVFIWVGMILGSVLGGYIPVWLWDESMWSAYGILFSTVGALIGIAIGFKFSTWLTEWI